MTGRQTSDEHRHDYDLLIAGGEVIDPGAGLVGPLDVAVRDGRVTAAESGIDPERAEVRALHERGLILDIGHGTGSFSYEVTEAMLAQGIPPDVISSDIHQLSVQGPMFDLPTTLSKFLNLGMSLPDVIERATARPAAAMRRPDLGTLRPGSLADLALFRLEEGDYTFRDSQMAVRKGTQRLINTLTMVDGLELPRMAERPPHHWSRLPEHQQGVEEP